MFERFTDRSRRVVVLAQEQARLLKHNYIGTEHLLLGLIQEGEGVAGKALTLRCGVTLEAAFKEVEEETGKGSNTPSGHIPFTPRARKVLELALREMLRLKHTYINTEHLLLGLLLQKDASGVRALSKLGVNLEQVKMEIYHLLRTDEHGTPKTELRVSQLNLAQLNYYIDEYRSALAMMEARRAELETSES